MNSKQNKETHTYREQIHGWEMSKKVKVIKRYIFPVIK